ncbi:hypothetical protein HWV62_19067 [Athelia sp. TMB]|nr:hypothetical protein HWV62_19067 [Athelia sp. TMB]
MLAANNSKLLEVYHENHTATVELQQTLLEDVFPHVMNELELGIESEAACWARVWLEDTTAIFHFYRRHKFTRSFAMESIRQNLVWRIQTIHPRAEAPPLGMLHCLPSDITDPFKRPIIVLKVSDLAAENGKEDLKDLRVLPASALSRILFPSKNELEAYFTSSCLPKEYGGTLAWLGDLNDPLRPQSDPLRPSVSFPGSGPGRPTVAPQTPVFTSELLGSAPRTPSQTPLYGYPSWYAEAQTPLSRTSQRQCTPKLFYGRYWGLSPHGFG